MLFWARVLLFRFRAGMVAAAAAAEGKDWRTDRVPSVGAHISNCVLWCALRCR